MSGEHLQDLRQRAEAISEANDLMMEANTAKGAGELHDHDHYKRASCKDAPACHPKEDLQAHLSVEWAIGMVLAAYDHVLFHPWQPGEESAWNGALSELLGARGRILAEVIPLRLKAYRRDTLVALAQREN
jgi:hypothetical protein